MISTESHSKNVTFGYSAIQAFFWIQYAVIMGFASIYLLDHGFTNAQIGMVIAAAGIVSAILQPAVASYADRPESVSLKRLIFALGALIAGMGILLILLGNYRFLAGLLYGGCIAFLQLMTPLVNSLGMESINQGKKLNFGVARGMGSVAYAVIAYALGVIVEKSGSVSVPLSIIFGFGAFLLSVLFFPFEKEKKKGKRSAEKSSGQNPIDFFRRYKRFTLVLGGCVLIYISHVLLNSFTYQIVESKGGQSAETGFVMALAALIELPPMFLFTYMVKKVRCDIWFRITGIFFFLKTAGTLLAPSIPAFYAVQIFQMLGWALMTVSSVYYVNSIMEEQDVIKGQAYMTMTYTLGSVIGALVGGKLIDVGGVTAMLSFGSVAALVGMVILLFGAERGRKERNA